MAISFTVVASWNESCYNEFEIKLSTRIAHKQQLKMKRNQAEELESSINDTLEELQELGASLSIVQEEVDVMEGLVNNLTTEVKELHTTCDSALAMDCCQVKIMYICSKGLSLLLSE